MKTITKNFYIAQRAADLLVQSPGEGVGAWIHIEATEDASVPVTISIQLPDKKVEITESEFKAAMLEALKEEAHNRRMVLSPELLEGYLDSSALRRVHKKLFGEDGNG